MNAVEAVKALGVAARTDHDLRLALTLIADRHGYSDFLSYAADNPDEVVMMAEAQLEIQEQTPPGLKPL